jgi:hypothetical protein
MWQVRQTGAYCHRLLCKKVNLATSLEHWIPTLTGILMPPRPRTLTPSEESILWEQVCDWLSADVIEQGPNQSWYNNPVFVAKKSGKIRTCIDCRPVNKITEEFDWPLPRLQELRHRFRGKKWFTRIDLKDAFFRIKIPKEYRKYTAFLARGRSYQFKRMPFGLRTAPSIFQRFMDHALKDHINIAYWYMDDILTGADDPDQLRKYTKQIMRSLAKHDLTVNQEKSEYEVQGTLYAGMWIFPQGMGPNWEKVKEALELRPPSTKKEKQSALGLVSYLRDFIPLVSHFTAELYPGNKEPMNQEAYHEQWRKLSNHIAKAICTLRHWNEQDDADLYTDASGSAVAAILIQNGKVVTVASRKLKPAETRYSTTDREHLSLVLAAERFKLFLHRPGGKTRVWNDHASLLNRRTTNIMPRQARMNEIISTWIPTIQHVKGEMNPADWFSRKGDGLRGGTIFV